MTELEVAIEAAKEGASMIMQYHGKDFKIHHKGEIGCLAKMDCRSH
jgi:hypothetical protein